MCASHRPLTPQDITHDLDTRRVGRTVVVLEQVGSTNDAALAAAEGDDADGLAVFAESQTAGRGRLGRQWVSPRGASVMCSVLLIEPQSAEGLPYDPGVLTLAAGVATCDAVGSTANDVHPVIRWPNDILVRERKLAGILIESRPLLGARAYVIGIGINCLQHEAHFDDTLRDIATSLEAESCYPVSRLPVAQRLLVELDRWLATRRKGPALRRAWLDRTEPLGQHIHLRQAGHEYVGRTIDIDPTAGLVVQLDGGGRRVFDPATTSRTLGSDRPADEPQ